MAPGPEVLVNIDRLRELADRWRAEAMVLRKRGATAQAKALESCVADHEQVLDAWYTEELTLRQASDESGFSYSRLQQMKSLNVGASGARRIRRCDLPYKSRRSGPRLAHGQPDLADEILTSKLTAE